MAGLYYIRIDEQYDPTIFRYGGSYSAQLGGRIRQTLFSSGNASSYAAYGQGTLPIGQATELTLGLRYTIEDRSVEANGERLFDNPPFVRPIPGLPLLTEEPLHNSDTFRELTWRASLDRHFSDEVMGYLSASRGFQSGGWNLQTPQNPAFGPETARRLRSRPEICRSLAALQGGCERLLLRLFRPAGFRAHADRLGDDQRHFSRNLWAGAAARRAAGPKDGRHLRGAAPEDAVQALPQRDLHQFQRRRGHPLCADHLRRHRQPPSLRAQIQVQFRREPSRSRWAGPALCC